MPIFGKGFAVFKYIIANRYDQVNIKCKNKKSVDLQINGYICRLKSHWRISKQCRKRDFPLRLRAKKLHELEKINGFHCIMSHILLCKFDWYALWTGIFVSLVFIDAPFLAVFFPRFASFTHKKIALNARESDFFILIVKSYPLFIAANLSFKSRYPSAASSVASTVFSMGQISVPSRLMMYSVSVPYERLTPCDSR